MSQCNGCTPFSAAWICFTLMLYIYVIYIWFQFVPSDSATSSQLCRAAINHGIMHYPYKRITKAVKAPWRKGTGNFRAGDTTRLLTIISHNSDRRGSETLTQYGNVPRAFVRKLLQIMCDGEKNDDRGQKTGWMRKLTTHHYLLCSMQWLTPSWLSCASIGTALNSALLSHPSKTLGPYCRESVRWATGYETLIQSLQF